MTMGTAPVKVLHYYYYYYYYDVCVTVLFRPGCTMPEIWDVEDEANRGKDSVCSLLKQKPTPHFTRVFRNSVYDVLKVNTS